jgi:hypothetical protein
VNQEWRLPTRVGFRFVFAYLVPLHISWPVRPASDWVSLLSPRIIPWVSAHALNIEVPAVVYSNNDLGDSAQGTAHTLFLLALAAVAVIIWSIADRKRAELPQAPSVVQGVSPSVCWRSCYGVRGGESIPGPNARADSLYAAGSVRRPGAHCGAVELHGILPRYTPVSTGLVETMGAVLMFVPRLTTIGALICRGRIGECLHAERQL